MFFLGYSQILGGYEYLHGGVPGAKRDALFKNFNNNPDKRVFLSTDAGGTGLNLQTASWMVNLDIPWNPAVLEQRIGRIHRLGQKRNVSIINLVSTGTIEHRMTELLKFKSSLAEGILDNGEDVVFMGESKFNKLMNSVEEMIPDSTVQRTESVLEEKPVPEEEKVMFEDPVEANSEDLKDRQEPLTLFDDPEDTDSGTEGEAAREAAPVSDPAELVKNGISFFAGLAKTLADSQATKQLVPFIVDRDEKDGKTYLKVPVESEKAVENILGMLGSLMKNLN